MKRKERPTVRVLIVSPQLLFAQAVAVVLAADYGMDILSEHSTSGGGAVAAASEHLPNVVVADAWMPDLQTAHLTEALKRRSPDTKVILLSSQHRADQIQQAIAAGADGFLPKAVKVDVLAEGIRRAHAGESPVFGRELDHMVGTMNRRHELSQKAMQRLGGLTRRERVVLSWLALGASTDAIAQGLFISPSTVKNHIKHVLAKTVTSSREELLAVARLAGVVAAAPTTQDFPFAPERPE